MTLSYTTGQVTEMARAETRAAERKARQNAERYGGCTLGEARTCDQARMAACGRCGWYEREAKRRKTLPLWRDGRGLWQKRVGVRMTEEKNGGTELHDMPVV